MSRYHWQLPSEDTSEVDWPSEVTPLVAKVLHRRGVTDPAAVANWLEPSYDQHIHDPMLYLQMDRAVERLIRAIREQQPITIYGDYDADGICATAIMAETLEVLGAKVNWYIPERLAEGYGLNADAVERIAKQGTQLLITVDCGTSNVGEIAQAKSEGMDVIVLDHHQAPPVLPEAVAIINPFLPGQTFPFQGHSSGGVAFTVARALLQASRSGQVVNRPVKPGWEKWLLDIVAISTVADMMPLQGENRIFVTFGLRVLRQTRRLGLQALFAVIGAEASHATETTIGFQITPRLNAAGRLQHAGTALRLLLAKDQETATQLAAELQSINTERQRLTEMAVEEAMGQVQNQGQQAAYAVFAPHWSPGIVGLIAGRIADRVWRPVLVMTQNGDHIVGSGRSIPGFDITKHLRTGSEYLLRFGGHAGACGFTLTTADQRQAFIGWWQTSVGQATTAAPDQPPLQIDAETTLQEITPETLDQLERLAPFGVANDRPRFLLRKIAVQQVKMVGQSKQHVRLQGLQQSAAGTFIGFRLAERADELAAAVDLVIEASWNAWNGRREPQLKIIDFQPTA